MQLIRNIIIIALLSFLLQLVFPWWIICLVGFVVGYFATDKPWQAFVAGFCAVFLVWFGYAFYIDQNNNHLLSSKIIQLFHLPNSVSIIFVSGLVGGLSCGLSALTGRLLRNIA
jgi:ABC-type antimicrobial peptide transport system permease subunit